MDHFSPTDSAIHVSNAKIDEIIYENTTTFVTISYENCNNCIKTSQTVKLVVTNHTIILNETEHRIPVTNLRVGMTVNASFSSSMTKSIPPQSSAFMIQITQNPTESNPEHNAEYNTIIGRILEVNRQNQTFTTISGQKPSSVIRFNVSPNTVILDRNGRKINFTRLLPGMRVMIHHASFMTASIPPQTTAFKIQIL